MEFPQKVIVDRLGRIVENRPVRALVRVIGLRREFINKIVGIFFVLGGKAGWAAREKLARTSL